MDAATIAILKKAVDLARVGIEYVQHDQQVMLGLRKPQWVEFHGKGIGRGNFEMNGFRITSVSGGDTVRLDCAPFDPWSRRWNGPDLVGNKIKDGRLESSLWHDQTWFFAILIAEYWGCSVLEVLQWANSLFAAAWKDYAKFYPNAKFVNLKVRCAYGATQFAAPWYHRLKRIFGLTLVVLCVSGCTGCALFDAPDDGITVTGSSGAFGDDDVESVQPWITTNIVQGVR